MKTVAIIPAGGSGKRLSANIAKQYLLLNSIPVLAHTLLVFQNTKEISKIILVTPPPDKEFVKRSIVETYGLTKVAAIVAGGGERQDSVRNGLMAITGRCDLVVAHDGVRPFVTSEMLVSVIATATRHGAASIGVLAKDTIKETDDHHLVKQTLPRRGLWQTQTPQAFQYKLFCQAHEAAKKDGFYATDDAALLERIGVKTVMISGDYRNIKITTPEDLIIAESFMKKNNQIKVIGLSGLGYDSHRFVKGRKLILGGVEIPFEYGLQGHSDADALLHAVCDALLGMAAAGDIGRHFPDSDKEYKNISSLILLEKVREIIQARGVSIHNLDVTVLMEKPKLAPYAAAIIANISKTLNISETAVSVKAKTNEGMGFVGHQEGVAVLVIAHGSERIIND